MSLQDEVTAEEWGSMAEAKFELFDETIAAAAELGTTPHRNHTNLRQSRNDYYRNFLVNMDHNCSNQHRFLFVEHVHTRLCPTYEN
jgi:hypothetical protein